MLYEFLRFPFFNSIPNIHNKTNDIRKAERQRHTHTKFLLNDKKKTVSQSAESVINGLIFVCAGLSRIEWDLRINILENNI